MVALQLLSWKDFLIRGTPSSVEYLFYGGMSPNPQMPVAWALCTGSPEESDRAQGLRWVFSCSVHHQAPLSLPRQTRDCSKCRTWKHTPPASHYNLSGSYAAILSVLHSHKMSKERCPKWCIVHPHLSLCWSVVTEPKAACLLLPPALCSSSKTGPKSTKPETFMPTLEVLTCKLNQKLSHQIPFLKVLPGANSGYSLPCSMADNICMWVCPRGSSPIF